MVVQALHFSVVNVQPIPINKSDICKFKILPLIYNLIINKFVKTNFIIRQKI